MPSIAYIALLPFDILTERVERVEPRGLRVQGRSVVMYWPFWNEEAGGRALAMVRSSTIPSRSLVEPFYRVPPLDMRLEVRFPPDRFFANAIRIDIAGEPDEDFATDIVNNLLRQFRVRTNQWWIGHAYREGEGLVRAAYRIDDSGFLASRDCMAGARIEPRLRIERALAPADFTDACIGVAVGQSVPAYWELWLDAAYYSVHKNDLRRALLESCIACEFAVRHEATRAVRESGRPEDLIARALSDRDLLHNLRIGLKELFGEQADYSQARPADFASVRRLWIVRGAIAHGQAASAIPDRAEAVMLMEASMRLIDWLTTLPLGTPRTEDSNAFAALRLG